VTHDGQHGFLWLEKYEIDNVNEFIKRGNVGVLKLFEAFFQYKKEQKKVRKRGKEELLNDNKERAKKLISLYFVNATEEELKTIVGMKSDNKLKKEEIERLMKDKNLVEFIKWVRA